VTRAEIKPLQISEEEYGEHCDNNDGYCLSCQKWTADSHIEPDAREYSCPDCRQLSVYGAEELAIMGMVVFVDEE
jgi:Zn finger protein HypA/HybF involved in hydrogenase expression